MNKRFLLACFSGFLALAQARAQLAITEVMTSEADSTHPDWWELTNFGTNNVDITGYSWNDDSHGGFSGADTASFAGVIVHPGEAIIVAEQKGAVTSGDTFRTWWGISAGVQVVVLNAADPGLGATGDSVRLWSTNIASMGMATNGLDLDQAPNFLVDRVDTIAATAGRSQFFNTNNGTFGFSSTNGIAGAFVAATTADVGSPGIASTNPAPIVIAIQPTNVLVNVGSPAVFQITAYGLPKPRFQWLFNGQPVDPTRISVGFTVTNNLCRGTLIVTNAQVTNAGTFRVVVTNGFQTVVSSNATLTVNTGPLAPVFTKTPPTNLFAYPGQTVVLQANAFGNPPPVFRWQFDGTNLDGQTDSQITFPVSGTNQSGNYTIIATNSAGSTNASVVLTITPKPNLRITEIQASEATNSDGSTLGHGDWWELSNLGSFPVNLQGYRFDDNSYSLSQAVTLTSDATIAPGESIVLCEDMTPDEFRAWWGADQLPPNLQIVDYHGSAVSFSGTGDALTLWNAVAITESDSIDSVSISTATTGVTFGFDPYTKTFFGFAPDGLSVAGVNGAFVAAVNGDIGSPGTIVTYPRFTSLSLTNGGAQLSWASQSNYTYTVQGKTNLADANWTTLTNVTAGAGNVWNWVDTTTSSQRFYRLILNP